MLRGAREHGKDASLSHNAFLQPEEPIVCGRVGRWIVPRTPCSLLPPCGRREKCTEGGCGPDFLERGRSPCRPFVAFVGSALPRTLPRAANRMLRRFLSSVCPAMPPSWAQSILSVMSSGRRAEGAQTQSWERLDVSPPDKEQ